MKKITVIVPDEMDRCLGSGGRVNWSKQAVNESSIKKILGENIDYHDYLIFKDINAIKVLSITDIEEHSF